MEYLNRIKDYLKSYIDEWNFYGVVSIVKGDNTVLQEETGFACMEFGVKNTLETCFTLGSNSKQFTAFSIMLLVDNDEINLQESANKYLPDDICIDPKITVHHLLSHTSGLFNCYNLEEDFFGIYNRATYSREDFFKLYINRQLQFEPGTQFNYNNANYNLLAWIIENVSGISFENYLKKNIFIPLNMTNSALDTGLNIIPYKAFPYEYDIEGIIRCPYYNEKFSIGAGAIVSNCQDLIKWHNCLKRKELLSPKTYEAFFTANLNNYCYGLESQTIHGRKCYLHGGDHFGVMTYTANFFNDDLFILILSNAEFGNQYKMATAICDLWFTGEYTPSEKLQTVELSEEEAMKYEGVYLDKKAELRRNLGNWELVRLNGEWRIPIRPVGKHRFLRLATDQVNPTQLKECEDGSYELWGFKKK